MAFKVIKIIATVLACLILLGVFYLFLMLFGIPVHDLSLWRLELRYGIVRQYNPTDSELIKSLKYLGGPDEHGSSHCVYAIGEIRRTNLSKNEVLKAYENVPSLGTKNLPSKFDIYFSDFESLPLAEPLTDWLYLLENSAKSHPKTGLYYLIYARQEDVPFWGDRRCDD